MKWFVCVLHKRLIRFCKSVDVLSALFLGLGFTHAFTHLITADNYMVPATLVRLLEPNRPSYVGQN